MNDPQFVEASRILAEKMIQVTSSVTSSLAMSQRLTYGFEALTSRKPRAAELSELMSLFEKQQKHFIENRDKAEKLLSIGEYPRDKSLDVAELAAYTVVVSMIMNFDEFVVER